MSEEPQVHIRFNKTGPDDGRKVMGLPPRPEQGNPKSGGNGAPVAPQSSPPPAQQSTTNNQPQQPREMAPPLSPPPEQKPSRLQAPSTTQMPSHSFNTKPFTSLLNNFGSGAGKGKGGTRPGSGGWRVPSGVSGDASFTYDSGGLDLSEWAELVKLKVRSNWIIPTAAYMGMKGITGIYLVIEKTGVVSQCEIIRQSGVISMDSAAFNAVRGSSPLPKLPDIYPKSSMEAHFTFYYNIFLQE